MKIEKDGMVVEDTHDKLVEMACGITCGCDEPYLKMVCHMDMKDSYSYSYQCSCGNSIVATYKRTEEEMMLWED